MKIGITFAMIAFAALRAAGQTPQTGCTDQIDGKPARQTVIYEELLFPEELKRNVRVRVFNQNGTMIDSYEVTPKKIKPDSTTYRSTVPRSPFEPTTQFVATTASAGCVSGVAYRHRESICVAQFKLKPLSLEPLDIEIVAPFSFMDVTRKLPMDDRGRQCTEKAPPVPRGAVIKGIIEGESVWLGLRRGADPFSLEFDLDLAPLREDAALKEYKPPKSALTDAAKSSGPKNRGGITRNAAEAIADVNVIVRRRQ